MVAKITIKYLNRLIKHILNACVRLSFQTIQITWVICCLLHICVLLHPYSTQENFSTNSSSREVDCVSFFPHTLAVHFSFCICNVHIVLIQNLFFFLSQSSQQNLWFNTVLIQRANLPWHFPWSYSYHHVNEY